MAIVLFLLLTGVAGAVLWIAVAEDADRAELAARSTPAPPERLQLRMQLLFVEETARALVIDGLLSETSDPIGLPATWALTPPDDAQLGSMVLEQLERWVEEGTVVDVEVRGHGTTRPTIAVRDDVHLVRLQVARMTRDVRP